MRTTTRTLIAFLTASGTAMAASGAENEGGWLTTLFIAFGVLIIVFQLFPGLFLFGSMMKGLFSRPAGETVTGRTETER